MTKAEYDGLKAAYQLIAGLRLETVNEDPYAYSRLLRVSGHLETRIKDAGKQLFEEAA